MQNFISVLFDQMTAEFTFFSYHEVMNNFLERRITPILSNSIAAFAAQYVSTLSSLYFGKTDLRSRYSTLPELAVRGLHNVANTYADHAKVLAVVALSSYHIG